MVQILKNEGTKRKLILESDEVIIPGLELDEDWVAMW
jgi:hypothetical protein